MLDERDYMRRSGNPDPTGSGMKCLFALIIVNVLTFMIADDGIKADFEMSVVGMRDWQLWRPLTAVFLHEGFFHLFFNMFGLYMFGSMSAHLFGAKKLLWLFLGTGVAGNLFWYAFNFGNYNTALLGASGAVMGVIMATAMLMPNVQVLLLFFPFPIKLKTMAIVFIAIEVFSEISNHGSAVAYLAHIGGFLGGVLFMELFMRKQIVWDPLAFLTGKARPSAGRRPPPGWTVSEPPPPCDTVPQNELDRILDKISRTGINSLSEEETETLRRAREQMKRP